MLTVNDIVKDYDAVVSSTDHLSVSKHSLTGPVFSISNEAPRLRRHLFYKFAINPDAEGYLYPIWEYGVYGSTVDARAWFLRAKHLPTAAIQGVSDAP